MYKGGFGGFGGGNMGGMQNMLRQAQKMQEELQRKQNELEEMEVIGTCSGNMVEVVCSGKGIIKAVRIKPEAVDPDDVEMLEDLITAAINDAQAQATKLKDETLGAMGGGMF